MLLKLTYFQTMIRLCAGRLLINLPALKGLYPCFFINSKQLYDHPDKKNLIIICDVLTSCTAAIIKEETPEIIIKFFLSG